MITGFNTDIEHDGVVYHVQTEDKGIDSPLILSLVYTGGEILASKRAPYEDLIAAGFDEKVLAQRLQRQHKLICAAINAGRIEDLKRMGARGENEPAVSPAPQDDKREASEEIAAAPVPSSLPPPLPRASTSAYTVHDPRRQSPLGEVADPHTGLVVSLVDEEEFKAGESCTLRVMVKDQTGGNEKPLGGVAVSVKILGTAFRPQLHSVKTQGDGLAVVSLQIPRFTSGRAAVLVVAEFRGSTTELRRVIQPSQ